MRQTQKRSRILAMILALVMCLGCLPGTAWASSVGYQPTPGGGLTFATQIEITDIQAQNSKGPVTGARFSGNTVTIPAGVTSLSLGIKLLSEQAAFNSNMNPNAPAVTCYDPPSGGCGLRPTRVTGHEAASGSKQVTLVLTGSATPGESQINFREEAFSYLHFVSDDYYVGTVTPSVDPDQSGSPDVTDNGWTTANPGGGWGTTPTGAGRIISTLSSGQAAATPGASNAITIKVEGSAQPQGEKFRVDFFPNGGTITSINGYSREKIMSHDASVPEDILFIDVNSGVAGMMTDSSGKLAAFPVVEREGYRFDGWYTIGKSQTNDAYDGKLTDFSSCYKASESMVFTAEADLAAKWTRADGEADNTHEVWFHLGGGKVTSVLGVSTSKMADGVLSDSSGNFIYREGPDEGTEILGEMLTGKDGKLAGLPVIERDGYTFDGWYTMETGGNKVTKDTVLSGAGQYGRDYLWARWSPAKDTCTVTFQLNGAPGKAPDSLKVAKGSAITLPEEPVWAGHTFLYWMSGTLNGNQLTDIVIWKNGDKVTKDAMLFAKWSTGEVDDTLKGLTYRFPNSGASYGYEKNYRIPLERYEMMFGDSQRAKQLYEIMGTWGGSCFGMSSTSLLFFEGYASTGSYRSGAKVPFDLQPGDASSQYTLTEFIEAMQVGQNTPVGSNATWQNADRLPELLAAVKSGPVVVSMLHNVTYAGHAVVAYGTEAGSNGETLLKIYDPNFPNTERSIAVTNGGDWHYLMNDEEDYGSKYNYFISYTAASDINRIWTGRQASTSAGGDGMNLLSLSASNAAITDGAGKTVATVKDGQLTTTASNVCPILRVAPTADGSGAASTGTALWLPTGQYTVTSKDAKSFRVSMTNVDQTAAVTTNASSVTLLVDDSKTTNSVQLDGAGKSYDITLSSSLDKGYKEVSLTGTTSAETTAAAQISGKLYGTNLDAKGTIKVDGKVSTSSVLAGSVPGAAAATPAAFPFTDVGESRWYRPYVQAAYEAGLVNGVTPTTYEPDKTLTLAESVTLAARIYAEAHGETVPSGGTPWYKAAYDYCVEKGVLDGKVFALADMPRTATRFEMVTILDGAVPSARLEKSVEVAKDGIPDLKESDAYGEVVYRWYRAGLIGGDADGSFSGSRDIKRSEVAKILCTINKLA